MNINNDFKESSYLHSTQEKNDTKTTESKQDNIDVKYTNLEKSFDISGLNKHVQTAYNENEAQNILKNVNYESEVQDFSKQNILDRFSQPLTIAQANLSADSVSTLLQ